MSSAMLPMLTDPVFADYMQAYGKGGLRALRSAALPISQALWYTVEFGLLEPSQGLADLWRWHCVLANGIDLRAHPSDSPTASGFDLGKGDAQRFIASTTSSRSISSPSLQYLLDVTTGTDFVPSMPNCQG